MRHADLDASYSSDKQSVIIVHVITSFELTIMGRTVRYQCRWEGSIGPLRSEQVRIFVDQQGMH